MNDKTLCDIFRRCREDMHLNYCQVEKQTGVPHDLVKRIEENSYNPRRLTFVSLARLAELYGLPLRWIREKLEEEIYAGD